MTAPYVLTLSRADRRGIVFAVAGFLAEHDCNIIDSAQFGDPLTGRFFMRVAFASDSGAAVRTLAAAFAPVAERFDLRWEMFDPARKPRALIMVSRLGHCLNDLLYRLSIRSLPIEVAAVVSNHPDMAPLAAAAAIRYVHIPVRRDDKARAEAALRRLYDDERCDFIVLARYMQVLSDDFCGRLPARIINIHHSFLPSFKGARPYHQAHERGVKLIGATAHYVTADLDEGPIIEQEVIRVDHAKSPDDFVAAGRDVESVVLARAVQWHAEHRVLVHGGKTVVFR